MGNMPRVNNSKIRFEVYNTVFANELVKTHNGRDDPTHSIFCLSLMVSHSTLSEHWVVQVVRIAVSARQSQTDIDPDNFGQALHFEYLEDLVAVVCRRYGEPSF